MPIIGLTDKRPAPPQLGVLRKGAAKSGNKPGADLEYFRFESSDQAAVERFHEIYGPEPRSIRIFVPFATTDENFEAWREEWSASSLKHRCDGQTMHRWLTDRGTYSSEPRPCPYAKLDNREKGCKQVGRLYTIVRDLGRFSIVTVLTTSLHDISEIHRNLQALESLRGDLRGIPLVLRRSPRQISTPSGPNGGRARREKWLLSIEAEPQWVELQLTAQAQAALPHVETLALPEWDGEEDDTETEVETKEADPRAEIIERMRRVFADQGKLNAWDAYAAKNVEGRSAEQLAVALADLEARGSKKLIEEIEGPIFQALKGAGVSGQEGLEKIAQIAEGEVGLEQMAYPTLVAVRDGLKHWINELKLASAVAA